MTPTLSIACICMFGLALALLERHGRGAMQGGQTSMAGEEGG